MKLVPIALCAVSLVLCFPAVGQDKKPLSKIAHLKLRAVEMGLEVSGDDWIGQLMAVGALDFTEHYWNSTSYPA
jgi:hypothetical protein